MTAIKQTLIEWFGPESVAYAAPALRVLVIILLAMVAKRLASRLIRIFRDRFTSHIGQGHGIKRAETLGRVIRYIASVAITLVAGMLILSEFGVSIAPILGAAGVVGLAVGFGAQSLVKDYFTGFFLLLEDQVARGDVVEVADKSGVVEDVTLRYVRLRAYNGDVHYIPNGLISTVTNMSRGFAFAVMDIGVAYREDLDEVYAAIREVAEGLRKQEGFAEKILEPLEIAGVEELGDSAVVVRCRIKVKPLEQWAVRRAYLKQLKQAFDAKGIEIPYPHVTLYAGVDKQGKSPAFRTEAA
ncbi:MAG: mechanosensitive ion channel family protein [Steroidobacteraceae bacterium]